MAFQLQLNRAFTWLLRRFHACSYTGSGLAYRASTSWGYLSATGYGGHIFPVVIGETGSQFIVPIDLDFYRDFSLYLNNLDYMADGKHTVTRDVFWW